MLHAPARAVTLPHGLTIRLGRNEAVAPRPQMRFAAYLEGSALPVAPPSFDYSAKADASIRRVYKNNVLGCCVISCGAHLQGVLTGNATGTPELWTDAQVVAQYEKIGGYVDGDPSTDQGCNEQDALDYWGHNGFPDGSKLLGNLNVTADNRAQVTSACWLFENLIFGMALPDAWLDPGPSGSGFVWDVAGPPNPRNGHCVLGLAADAQRGILIATWGMTGWITFPAVAKYCATSTGELHTALSLQQIAKAQAKAPNGLDWASIVADFDELGGKVPIPSPSPSPPPVIPPGLTLAQAEAAAVAGLRNHWPKGAA